MYSARSETILSPENTFYIGTTFFTGRTCDIGSTLHRTWSKTISAAYDRAARFEHCPALKNSCPRWSKASALPVFMYAFMHVCTYMHTDVSGYIYTHTQRDTDTDTDMYK